MLRASARLALLVLPLALGCSEGASSATFGFPPGPTPTNPSPTTGGSGTSDATGPIDAGECCVANDTPGCNDAAIETCVCNEVPSCCADPWSTTCAGLVDELGCGQCGVDEAGDVDPDDSGGTNTQDCCVGGPAPGCEDAAIQACVCAEFDFCCTEGWDKVCASGVEALGCGHCGGAGDTGVDPTTGGGDTGEPPPPPPTNDCCTPAATPGCTEAGVESCVCMQDPFCCDSEWDQVCVDQVDSFGCGDCGGVPPGPTCCMAQPGPGCGDPIAELCTCLVDSSCCDTQWDASCALLADILMCISC